MWIGILVLITFSFCAVACLVISIRGAMRRQWHVFVALLIPALAIGGTIFDMVAKPLSYEIIRKVVGLRTSQEPSSLSG